MSGLANLTAKFDARDAEASIFSAAKWASPMNEVFPELCSAPIGEVAAGSIALIPHYDGPFLTLLTAESVQSNLRSLVILNLKQSNYPTVVFHENWSVRDACLYYKTPLRFELSNKEDDIGTSGNWWRDAGVIISAQNEFFIRAVAPARHMFRYVNIQTGAIFSGELPPTYATFGVWSIWLRDPLRERSASIFNFDIHTSKRSPD